MTKIWFQQNVVISLVFSVARAKGLLRHYVLKGKYETLKIWDLGITHFNLGILGFA